MWSVLIVSSSTKILYVDRTLHSCTAAGNWARNSIKKKEKALKSWILVNWMLYQLYI